MFLMSGFELGFNSVSVRLRLGKAVDLSRAPAMNRSGLLIRVGLLSCLESAGLESLVELLMTKSLSESGYRKPTHFFR